jgi:hypothetical protein
MFNTALVDNFVFHNFDSVLDNKCDDINQQPRMNPRRKLKEDERQDKINALYACAEGDLPELRREVIVDAKDRWENSALDDAI